MQIKQSRSRWQSFRHAFAGLWYVLRTQRNAWIHAGITILVILLGWWLGLNRYDWTLIMIAICFIILICVIALATAVIMAIEDEDLL